MVLINYLIREQCVCSYVNSLCLMASANASKDKPGETVEQVVCILRHAERLDDVDMNWLASEQPRKYDPPLSPAGFEEAASVFRQLGLDTLNLKHVVSSPFLRTLQTAAPIVRELSLSQLTVCNGLCEYISEETGFSTQPVFEPDQQTGACAGISIEFMGDPSPLFPETLNDAKERYRAAIRMLSDRYWPAGVLIVTHAIAVRAAFPFFSAPPLNGLIPYCGGVVAKRVGTVFVFLKTINDIPTWHMSSFEKTRVKHNL